MSRSLDDLHPKLKEQFLQLQALAKTTFGLNIICTNTLRTAEEQAALYAQGRQLITIVNAMRGKAGLNPITEAENKVVTNAPNNRKSWHGYGLAFDIAITDATGKKIDWTKNSDWNGDKIDDWVQVGTLAEKCGLEWGGNFTNMYDPPHYQNRMGMTIQEANLKLK